MKVIIFGIRRSGNSVVREWFAEQMGLEPVINASSQNLKENAVNSIEDYPLTYDILSSFRADKKIVILRDPFNLFASRIRHYNLLSPSGSGWIDKEMTKRLWLMYAKIFFQIPEIIFISYNKFIKEEDYRRTICKKIGGTFQDNSIHRVNDNGLGSSFDGIRYDGNAQEMKVFDRWKEFQNNKYFIQLFTDEIRGLSNRIFGDQEWNTLFS